MFDHDLLKNNSIFDFYPPKETGLKLTSIISIPHSGERIPEEFKSYLVEDSKALMCDIDYKVDELVDIKRLNEAGVAVIVATTHRFCVDLNRAPDLTVLNWKSNTRGDQIVIDNPVDSEIQRFKEIYYTPYYKAIELLIDIYKTNLEEDILIPFIDLHSMPSTPTIYHLKLNPNQSSTRADFCLSDLGNSNSCSPEFMENISKGIERFNFSTLINDPYSGGYITQFVNKIARTNNIQIETNRSIYMDEDKKEFLSKYTDVKMALTELFVTNITL